METEVKNMNAEDSGKKKKRKIAAIVAAVLILAAIPAGVYAYRAANGLGGPFAGIIRDRTESAAEETEARGPKGFRGENMTPPEGEPPEGFGGERPEGGPGPNGQMGPGQGGQNGPMGQNGQTAGTSAEPLEIKTSSLTENSAEELSADTANAQTIVMSDENSKVKIDAAGTYIVTGSCADGSITVKKGTTGVVLILKDLDLTSSSSATLSLNKGTETKVIIEGTVKLTDAEDIANEDSDDFDGAVIKAKAGSSSVLTGTGTLYVNGVCEHGIKVSDLEEDDIADGYSEASFIVDGATIIIDAADDGMNSGTDLTIKSGDITVRAEDDGIKADYILTIGKEGTAGPTINVEKAGEAIEGAVINIYSGDITVDATDDGLNAANKDLDDYDFSINIMGGTVTISAGADGLDSNGNINITGGLTTIAECANNGGEGGLDYEGECYIAEGCLVNPYGTTMDSGMGGAARPGNF